MKFILFALLGLTVFAQTDTLATDCLVNATICDEGYFLSHEQDERRCLSESSPDGLAIDNCEKHEWDDTLGIKCAKCANKFLVGKSGICVAFELDDCLQATADPATNNDAAGYTAQCTECDPSKALDINAKVCVNKTDIANCTEEIKDTTQKCKKCNDGTFLNSASPAATCSQPAAITNCTAGSYEKVSESAAFKCTACDAGFILQTDGSACHAFTAIATCNSDITKHTHDGALKCNECATPATQTLLTDKSACATTPANTDDTGTNILDCTEFITVDGSTWTCGACQNNKVLATNAQTCEDASGQTAAQCEEWLTATNSGGGSGAWNCKTCKSTHPIKKDDNTECKEVPTKETPVQSWWDDNCATYGFSTVYYCAKCNSGFWLDSGKCKTIERDIPNCKTWTSQYQCATCEDGYTYSDNRCYACPARQWVAPTTGGGTGGGSTGGGSTNGTSTNTTGGGSTGGGSTNGTNSSASIIAPVVLVLLALLF